MALTAQLCTQGGSVVPLYRLVHSLKAQLHQLFGMHVHHSALAATPNQSAMGA